MAQDDDKPDDVDDVDDAQDQQDDDGDTDGADDKPPAKPGKPAVPKQGKQHADDADDDPESLRVKLSRANYESQQRRKAAAQTAKELADAKAQIEALQVATASEAEKALILAKKEAAAEAEARWRPQIIAMRADAALMAAQCTDPADRELLLGRIKTDLVQLDDAGQVTGGLEEQVAELRDRYPKLFTQPRRTPSARDVDAGNKKPPTTPQTATEQLVARLNGR